MGVGWVCERMKVDGSGLSRLCAKLLGFMIPEKCPRHSFCGLGDKVKTATNSLIAQVFFLNKFLKDIACYLMILLMTELQ